jgi:hypothetical protein
MGRGSVGRDIFGLRMAIELVLLRGSLATDAKCGSDGFRNHLEGLERRRANPDGELERA